MYASVPVMADTPETKNTTAAVELAPRPPRGATGGAIPTKPTYVVDADKLLSSHPKELWAYRELFLLLVKRDFVAVYKQTVLGPLWFFVQPFLASLVFMIVFGQIARLPTTEFASARVLHVRHHCLELFLELPQPGRCHLSRQRRPVPQNLFPAVDRAAEPDHHEPAQFYCSTCWCSWR